MTEKLLLAAIATLAFSLFVSVSPSQKVSHRSAQSIQVRPHQSAVRSSPPSAEKRFFRRPSFLNPRG